MGGGDFMLLILFTSLIAPFFVGIAIVLMLKAMKEKSEKASNEMSDLTKELIENGAVNQWAKKPIYYFVKGLRKVALVIDEGGDFKVSKKYPATSDKDQAYLKALGIKS